MLAVDVSNYSGPLSARALGAWKALGVGLVIVQAVNPPSPYPPGVTRQQLAACRDAGIPTDVYVYLWPSDSVSTLRQRMALADGFPVRRMWLDVEEAGVNAAGVQWALEQLDTYPAKQPQAGVYSGAWFWTDARYLGNVTMFRDRPLWDSRYDGIPDASRGFKSYGGWSSPAVKQYAGTSTLVGVGGVDLDVLSDAEAALLG